MVWCSHLLTNFPQFIVIHTVKCFSVVKKTKVNVFLEFPCFFYDPAAAAAAAAKSLQSCLTLCDLIDGSPPGSPVPAWDSPGKNTGVGCHFLPQCMKVKSESEVAQSGLTLSDPMDYSLPGSSIHGVFQARELEWLPLPSPYDPTDVGNLISYSSAFPNSSLYIWKFSVLVLLKPNLEDFEHYLARHVK